MASRSSAGVLITEWLYDSPRFGRRSSAISTSTFFAPGGAGCGGGGGGGAGGSTNYSKPFFIGCGFHKPHAPYYAPKEFFDRLPGWPVEARQKKPP